MLNQYELCGENNINKNIIVTLPQNNGVINNIKS